MSKRTDRPPNAREPGEGRLRSFVSRLRRTSPRSLWSHAALWIVALCLICLPAFGGTKPAASHHPNNLEFFAGIIWVLVVFNVFVFLAIALLVSTLRNWERLGVAQTISSSLLLFTLLLGFVAFGLSIVRQWGVYIEACRTVGELETCQGQASPAQVLGMLAWHAADVVPGLDITHSLEWPRPARSANAVVGASILAIRLWVVIGILGVLKLLWDRWGPSRSSRESTDRPPDAHEPGGNRGGKDR